MSKTKRTELGWPGHFVLADRCRFRRNTLLERGEKRFVVSTVGMMTDRNRDHAQIGYERDYETLIFESERRSGYWEAGNQVSLFEDEEAPRWSMLWEDHQSDARANEMHEENVAAVIRFLEDEQ